MWQRTMNKELTRGNIIKVIGMDRIGRVIDSWQIELHGRMNHPVGYLVLRHVVRLKASMASARV